MLLDLQSYEEDGAVKALQKTRETRQEKQVLMEMPRNIVNTKGKAQEEESIMPRSKVISNY